MVRIVGVSGKPEGRSDDVFVFVPSHTVTIDYLRANLAYCVVFLRTGTMATPVSFTRPTSFRRSSPQPRPAGRLLAVHGETAAGTITLLRPRQI